MYHCWCHYTKSNPIDDQSNISSKNLQKQNFKPLGHYTCMQCGTSHLQTVQENILSHIILATYKEVYSGNRQIHTKCQLQYFHPPHISTSGKCHCVIIHQTTKATEYTALDVKVSAQVTTVTYMHQSQPSLHSLRKHFTVHLQL